MQYSAAISSAVRLLHIGLWEFSSWITTLLFLPGHRWLHLITKMDFLWCGVCRMPNGHVAAVGFSISCIITLVALVAYYIAPTSKRFTNTLFSCSTVWKCCMASKMLSFRYICHKQQVTLRCPVQISPTSSENASACMTALCNIALNVFPLSHTHTLTQSLVIAIPCFSLLPWRRLSLLYTFS